MKTYKTEHFTMALEAELQWYRHLLNRMFRNNNGGRATGLQTHSQPYCSLGSVYFTGNILAATDRLELLCQQ